MTDIAQSAGYKSLRESVDRDYAKDKTYQNGGKPFHDYEAKFDWVMDRVKHYSEKTGIAASDILDEWEKRRDYWYMNYYQDSRQPTLGSDHVRVFDDIEQFQISAEKSEYRCPNCNGISTDAYTCNSGAEMSNGKICDWKAYGLFGTLGGGVHVFLKTAMRGESIFMPVAWEKKQPK